MNSVLARKKVLLLCPSQISCRRRRRSVRLHLHSNQQLANLGLTSQQVSCGSCNWSTETFLLNVSPFYSERFLACLLQFNSTLQNVSPKKMHAPTHSFVFALLLNLKVDILQALFEGLPTVSRAFWTQSLPPQLQGLLSDRLFKCHMKTFVSF